HAAQADYRVLDRAVERVAHVQRAGHVRRRDRDREVLGGVALGLGMEYARLLPALEDALLHVRRDVARALLEGLQPVAGHWGCESRRAPRRLRRRAARLRNR